MNIQNKYIDFVSVVCIPLIIAIFTFALPLLLQTAARIDDKYKSTLLIKSFRKEWRFNFFLWTLIVSLVIVLLWMLQIESPIDNFFINNSALISLAIFSIVLMIATICVIYLIYIYYVPEFLLNCLIKQYNKSKKEKAFYFESISKILFYSINKADEPLSRRLLQFYFDSFVKYRVGKENQIVEYPAEFYNGIFEANELLCKRERKTVSSFNDSTLYELFIDEYQHTVISEKTFSFLWMCHIQSLSYNKDDFIMSYWKKAHQYFNFFLESKEKKYNEDYSKILNENEIQERGQERERFLEFHYALGGILLSRDKYGLIKQITSWTNQVPPKYVLVPETMEEVITRFMAVSKINPVYYEQKYPFPNISGVNADSVIQMWIKRYIAILFLRQYVLYEYFVYSRTLDMPSLPQTLQEKRRWNDELDSLKKIVDDYLTKKEVLKQLDLGGLSSPKWFTENNKTCPDDLINKYRQTIQDDIEQTKQTQGVDKDKKKKFEDATKHIISGTYKEYAELFGVTIDKDYNNLFYKGRYQLMEKEAFANDQEVSYANFDTIVAETVSIELKRDMLNIFMLMSKSQYLLSEQVLFEAINKLELNKDDFSIIAIGVNLNYFKAIEKELKENNGKWRYNGIPIIEIWNTMNEFFTQSFIIIKNEDLPCIIHNIISEEKLKKYKLENIDKSNNTYTSIINLNESEFSGVKDEVAKSSNLLDLSKKVLVCVDMSTEIRCKKSAKCLQLKVFSQFYDKGIPNKLNNIKNIW